MSEFLVPRVRILGRISPHCIRFYSGLVGGWMEVLILACHALIVDPPHQGCTLEDKEAELIGPGVCRVALGEELSWMAEEEPRRFRWK